MNYYERTATINTDGTPLFAIDYDKESESDICNLLSKAWGCEIHPFGRLSPIDFYAVRDGRLVGVLELKTRSHESSKYPTVFLNVRKWLSLMLAQSGLGCPAVFVVRFIDGIRYISVSDIDAHNVTIGGTKKIVKSHTDIEPVIEVLIDTMKAIGMPDSR